MNAEFQHEGRTIYFTVAGERTEDGGERPPAALSFSGRICYKKPPVKLELELKGYSRELALAVYRVKYT